MKAWHLVAASIGALSSFAIPASAQDQATYHDQFHYTSAPGSMEYWLYGRDVGSLEYWLYGQGPGSLNFWEHGQAPLSRNYWEYGRDEGSAYFWQNGRTQWSNYFWNYGNYGLSEYAFGNVRSESPGFVPITLCLGARLDIPVCEILQTWAVENPAHGDSWHAVTANNTDCEAGAAYCPIRRY